MSRELHRLSIAITLAFIFAALGTTFWSTLEGQNLLRRDDNPRKVLDELNIARGAIYDRNGVLIAYSQANTLGVERVYPYPEVAGAIGYYSYQYGQSGLEEGYNTLLRGDDLRSRWQIALDDFMHRPITGADIRTTLDLSMQQALAEALKGYSGAGIVVSVPSGEVLAMVSKPGYDPNRIDQILQDVEAGEIPLSLLNRVTAGQYQPGGALQTLILSEMLAAGMPLNQPVTTTGYTLEAPPLNLECNSPTQPTTLAEAYQWGCPAPMIEAVGSRISPAAFTDKLLAAGLLSAPHLSGYLLPEDTPALLDAYLPAEAAGQGALTVTPLHMVQVIAALLNQGGGVPLHLGDASRAPNSETWTPLDYSHQAPAVMQPLIAQQIRLVLEAHPWSDEPLYGHASRAYSGDKVYEWFLGWTPREDGTYAVIVIVVEEGSAVEIAGETIKN